MVTLPANLDEGLRCGLQMEVPQCNLKFKFPAHIISLVVRTTGCRLNVDKIVAVGAAFVKIVNPNTLPIIVKDQLFQFTVEPQPKPDAAYITADEFKKLQTQVKPAAQAVNDLVSFVKDCLQQDASSYIAAQNPVSPHHPVNSSSASPLCVRFEYLTLSWTIGWAASEQMVELGMLEVLAAKHCEGFMSFSHLMGTTGSGEQARVPIDLGSLACGLVSTDGKSAGGKAAQSKPPVNGRPWATLSEYLQEQIAPGDFNKHVPHPEPSSGRLEPHKEAGNKGWLFGNVSPPCCASRLTARPFFFRWMLTVCAVDSECSN